MTQRTIKPVNQKALYHSFSDLYEKIMNDEIDLDKADKAVKALNGMNSVYANELKRASIESDSHKTIIIRNVELKLADTSFEAETRLLQETP